jgi:hypothetical protein
MPNSSSNRSGLLWWLAFALVVTLLWTSLPWH